MDHILHHNDCFINYQRVIEPVHTNTTHGPTQSINMCGMYVGCHVPVMRLIKIHLNSETFYKFTSLIFLSFLDDHDINYSSHQPRPRTFKICIYSSLVLLLYSLNTMAWANLWELNTVQSVSKVSDFFWDRKIFGSDNYRMSLIMRYGVKTKLVDINQFCK